MLIAVVGDTHGRTAELIKKLRLYKPEHLLFTGDFYNDGIKIAKALRISFNGVLGNCDGRSPRAKEERIIEINNFVFLLVHGHKHGVKGDLMRLHFRAQEVKAHIALFGHTHINYLDKVSDIWLMNPGSPSLPRAGSKPSFGLINCSVEKLVPTIIYMNS